METLFCVLLLISLICLIIGIIKPKLVLVFLKGDKTRKKVILIFGILSILFFVLFGLVDTSSVLPEKKFGEEVSPVVVEKVEGQNLEEGNLPKEMPQDTKEVQPEIKVYGISIGQVAKTELLKLRPWTDGAVSINLPVGWDIYTGGRCATKSILARDPFVELKQVFYFSEAGPVYANKERKQEDQINYLTLGGYKLPYLDSPLVTPLTAENFLNNFEALANMPFFQEAFPQVPIMSDIQIINEEEITNKPDYATDGKLIRAEFKQNNKLGEGYFYIITVKDIIGLGYGVMFVGITAPKGLLDLITPSLKESLESYTINQAYVTACINENNKAVAGILKTGRILNESSNTIMDVWENKLESEQRMAEKQNDAILGYSRLYNPDTDEVYEITPEFYDHYQIHGNELEMNYLEELPDDKWGYVPLNGAEYIK